MIKLQTPVADSPCKVGISYKDKIMLLGSCFTDNIGAQLRDLGFDVCINPFGTMYNPSSIREGVRRLLKGIPFTETDCVEIGAGDRRICSFFHHTSHARNTTEEFLENANRTLSEASDFFKSCNKVIITLGTSWCFRHINNDIIVTNCLKHVSKEFRREFLGSEQTAGILREIVTTCPDKEFIFTVSPIRHFKDGAHGNQLSKASLLLATDIVIQQEGRCDYFPSYEIMMDELRDYRFYAEDMCHPSAQAIGYIRERFIDWALPVNEHEIMLEKARSFRLSQHRPLAYR